MELQQIRSDIRTKGYAVVRNVVPPALVQNLLRVYNGWSFRVQRTGLTELELDVAKRWHAAPDHEYGPAMNTLATYFAPYANALLGTAIEDNRHFIGNGPDTEYQVPKEYHLDGGWQAIKDKWTERFPLFDLIIGAFLTPVYGLHEGGVLVWEGGHLKVQEAFNCPLGGDIVSRIVLNEYDFGTPKPIIADVGDIFISHWALPHGSDRNALAWPSIRTYVRYSKAADHRVGSVIQKDIWHGWEL